MLNSEILYLDDGKPLLRTVSDSGMMLERDGALFCEAIDPIDACRTYNETDTPIETESGE